MFKFTSSSLTLALLALTAAPCLSAYELHGTNSSGEEVVKVSAEFDECTKITYTGTPTKGFVDELEDDDKIVFYKNMKECNAELGSVDIWASFSGDEYGDKDEFDWPARRPGAFIIVYSN
jgi:hypothetical protein